MFGTPPDDDFIMAILKAGLSAVIRLRRTDASDPFFASASCTGRSPRAFLRNGSAPKLRRSTTIPSLSVRTARCNGVFPVSSLSFLFARSL